MKRIFILATDMEIGGAEKALIGFLQSVDYSNYQIDLFLLHHQGPLMKLIPSEVNILPEVAEYSCYSIPIFKVLKKRQFKMFFGRALGILNSKVFLKKNNIKGINSVDIEYSFKYTKRYLPRIGNGTYDLAIGFTIPYYIIQEKVEAKTKLAWIHTDYTKIPGDTKSENKLWNRFDYIVSISDSVTQAFVEKYPLLKDKIILIENILTKQFVKEQSKLISVGSEMIRDGDEKIILSIGRFTYAKNFDNIPAIADILKKNGIAFKWYIIGYGDQEKNIKEQILKYGVSENVIVLGKKSNPYPYINACDVYIQPSRFEGKSVSVREAQLLEKPVIITDYPTAQSQLNNGVDGIIVPLDNEKCAKSIIEILEDHELCLKIIDYLKDHDLSNSNEILKVYEIIKESQSDT